MAFSSIDGDGQLRWRARDWCAAALLFAATATVVLWQNARLTVLWDVSYILENATRIASGQLPYRDFAFPYAPLTFLVQSLIIRLCGRAYWHHIVYAALVGGLATVLAWRVLLRLLAERVAHAWWASVALAAPLCVLGIYCIFPHPFYDPDCTLAMLAAVWLLLRIEEQASPRWMAIAAGVLVVLPIFIKQNVGLLFAVAMMAAIKLEWLQAWRAGEREAKRRGTCVVAGATVALAAGLATIAATVGLGNYVHWTLQFAAQRRLPGWSLMLGVYSTWWMWPLFALMVAGAALAARTGCRWLRATSVVMMCAPFVWAVLYIALDSDDSERAERLLDVWPPVMVAALVLCVLAICKLRGVRRWLPVVLLVAVHGAFLSQQLWGSTYALWPLLMVLVACSLASLSEVAPRAKNLAFPLTATIAALLIVAGAFYVRSEERLSYVNMDGELAHSTLPQLKGLAMRGPWIADFEELVRYTDHAIPRDEQVLTLPGEDLFYFTSGRLTRFPATMFDHTVNPYSTGQIARLARERDVRWIILKRDLQLGETPFPELHKVIELLPEFEQVESLDNYDIYRRR